MDAHGAANGSNPSGLPGTSDDHMDPYANDQGVHGTAEVLAEVSETHFTTAPICLVLTEDVNKIFLKGDPLIVGTTMGDIQTFFQKVIAEAQLGMEQNLPRPGSYDTSRMASGSGRTNSTVDPAKLPLLLRKERYPVPYIPYRRLKLDTASRVSTDVPAAESDNEDGDGERCEIPLDAIKLYLSDKKYFPGWSSNSKRNLRKRCDDFALENGELFYKTRKGRKVHCVEDRAERMRLIWQQHSIDHRRRDRLFSALKEKYYWKGMLQDVNRVLDSCEFCAKVRETKDTGETDDAEMSTNKKTSKRAPTEKSPRKRAKKASSTSAPTLEDANPSGEGPS